MIDNQRIISLVSFLKENKRIRNQQDFVERIGSDKSTVSQILGGKLSVPNNMFEKIHNAFPDISLSWLVTGEGDMLKSENKEEKEADSIQPQGIPHIEQIDAWCGKGQNKSMLGAARGRGSRSPSCGKTAPCTTFPEQRTRTSPFAPKGGA